MTTLTAAAREARRALTNHDPASSGASSRLAELTAEDWRSLDTQTRALADEWLASELGTEFCARSTRALLTAAQATRDAADRG